MTENRFNSARRYAAHDLGDFAQEFLSRNPRYRSAFLQMREAIVSTTCIRECQRMAHSWGLAFPFRSNRKCQAISGALALPELLLGFGLCGQVSSTEKFLQLARWPLGPC